MDLTLILGPMKSGKSFDLIRHFAPLTYTNIPFILFQSSRNVRDSQISSRGGMAIEAVKVDRIPYDIDARVIGIDEMHMFGPENIPTIERLLKKRIEIIASGLDTDYQGKMFEITKGLMELGPKEVRYKRAVCEICKSPTAVYSQVLRSGLPITEGMPPVIPDDGTYTYQALCRYCFVKPSTIHSNI